MATIPAYEVPVRPTVAGKHVRECGIDECGFCESEAAYLQADRISTDAKSHRTPKHSHPYSEDAEIGAGWRAGLFPAKTSHRQAA